MKLVVSFPGNESATLEEVGGKGYSLIRMVEAGLPVPPGAALTTAFFGPWFKEIQSSEAWTALARATPDKWPSICDELKGLCPALPLTAAQGQALTDLCRKFEESDSSALLAVRSSSPEEDLVTASFAGGYETRLGVRPAGLEDAVRACFASSLDERVLVYKQEHGFDVLSPRFAVIVQQQVDSEVAGVGFSINPLSNDYDEAVIDANWGLGESVVAGLASPDHFVVDKVGGQVVEQTLGAKQRSIWLDGQGGTRERYGYRSAEPTLSRDQLVELVEALGRIEHLYGRPVDVEWAYAGGQLQVLQARPITRYVPLPPEMLTEPGERRRLYSDAGLSQGLVINQPISPLGLSWLQEILYGSIVEGIVGIDDFTPAGGLVFAAGSRFYLQLSNLMRLGMSPKMMARNSASYDALVAEILANIDSKRYRAAKRPAWLRFRLLLSLPKALWMIRGFFWRPIAAVLMPGWAWRSYQRQIEAYEVELTQNLDYSLPLEAFAQKYTQIEIGELMNLTVPTLVAGLASPTILVSKNAAEERALAEKLRRGLTDNLVVEQGIALFRLAKLLARSDFDDLGELAKRVENRQVPAGFLSEWDAFLGRFGSRGPHEMDVASPRYADDPLVALQQMASMTVDEAGFDPEVAHRHNVEERGRAYEELMGRWGWPRRALLRRIYRLIELFGGTRDTPKYHVVMLTYAIRRRALMEGKRLASAGRLDAAEHIFDLTLGDIEQANRDPDLDLRALRVERTRFGQELAALVTELPQVIDSRGRILRPPPHEGRPGELTGMSVSPGQATGPVKVLHHPREKPVRKGDILVAYTTDPGWTPLFVNAAAVVLEVGGTLQHGAVIAREYGKPCVVGIDRVLTRLQDGQRVEVDGTAGTVRLLT